MTLVSVGKDHALHLLGCRRSARLRRERHRVFGLVMHSVYITKYHRKILDAAPLDWLAGHAQQVLAKMDCRLLSSAIWWRRPVALHWRSSNSTSNSAGSALAPRPVSGIRTWVQPVLQNSSVLPRWLLCSTDASRPRFCPNAARSRAALATEPQVSALPGRDDRS